MLYDILLDICYIGWMYDTIAWIFTIYDTSIGLIYIIYNCMRLLVKNVIKSYLDTIIDIIYVVYFLYNDVNFIFSILTAYRIVHHHRILSGDSYHDVFLLFYLLK